MSFNTACPLPVARYSVQVVAIGKHISSLDEVGNYDIKAYFDELHIGLDQIVCILTCKNKNILFV